MHICTCWCVRMCVRVCFMRLSSRDIYYKYVCKYILSLYPRVRLILPDGPANETDSAGTLGFQACSVTRQSKRYSGLRVTPKAILSTSVTTRVTRTQRGQKEKGSEWKPCMPLLVILGTYWGLRVSIGDCASPLVTAPYYWWLRLPSGERARSRP